MSTSYAPNVKRALFFVLFYQTVMFFSSLIVTYSYQQNLTGILFDGCRVISFPDLLQGGFIYIDLRIQGNLKSSVSRIDENPHTNSSFRFPLYLK